MNNIAIFASGSGTNAQAICEYFQNSTEIRVSLILSNKSDAYVIERAKSLNIPSLIFDKKSFSQSDIILNTLKSNNIDFIILAGFLWLVPKNIIDSYNRKIINIHPALLPKFGGKGMYGMNVHNAVIENKENESGITIHFVNEVYDSGDIIFQAKCEVNANDTPETVAQKIHELEYRYFAKTIEEAITGRK